MNGVIEEKVFALKLIGPQQIRRRLESLDFTYTTPIRPSADLQGYWQTPHGPMVTIWLMPLTQADMEIGRTLQDGERFVRFYLHVKPFEGGPQYPPVDRQTAALIWKAIDIATGPFARFIAGTETRVLGLFSRMPRRYAVQRAQSGQTP